MSLYTVTIEDRIYKVNISGDHCTVNGEEVDATMLPLNHNGLHVLHHGKQAYEVFLSNQEADTYQMLMFGGRRIVTQITITHEKTFEGRRGLQCWLPGRTDARAGGGCARP